MVAAVLVPRRAGMVEPIHFCLVGMPGRAPQGRDAGPGATYRPEEVEDLLVGRRAEEAAGGPHQAGEGVQVVRGELGPGKEPAGLVLREEAGGVQGQHASEQRLPRDENRRSLRVCLTWRSG